MKPAPRPRARLSRRTVRAACGLVAGLALAVSLSLAVPAADARPERVSATPTTVDPTAPTQPNDGQLLVAGVAAVVLVAVGGVALLLVQRRQDRR